MLQVTKRLCLVWLVERLKQMWESWSSRLERESLKPDLNAVDKRVNMQCWLKQRESKNWSWSSTKWTILRSSGQRRGISCLINRWQIWRVCVQDCTLFKRCWLPKRRYPLQLQLMVADLEILPISGFSGANLKDRVGKEVCPWFEYVQLSSITSIVDHRSLNFWIVCKSLIEIIMRLWWCPSLTNSRQDISQRFTHRDLGHGNRRHGKDWIRKSQKGSIRDGDAQQGISLPLSVWLSRNWRKSWPYFKKMKRSTWPSVVTTFDFGWKMLKKKQVYICECF